MNNDDLKLIRKSEDLSIIKHLEAILRIIDKKCYRCQAQSCMGCIFSIGYLRGFVLDGLELMKKNR